MMGLFYSLHSSHIICLRLLLLLILLLLLPLYLDIRAAQQPHAVTDLQQLLAIIPVFNKALEMILASNIEILVLDRFPMKDMADCLSPVRSKKFLNLKAI